MLRPLALLGAAAVLTATASAGDHSCPSGNCQNQGWTTTVSGCPTCQGQCQTGHCQSGTCSLCQSKGWPDKGWNPPARYPIQRDGIWYRNMWPQAWYGNQGGHFISNAPMVYQPTDTTQLGYSYAKVPTWQARPGMLPPTPYPPNFHARVCVPRPHAGRCFDGHATHAGHGWQTAAGHHCPACQQGQMHHPVSSPPPAVPMQTPDPVPAPTPPPPPSEADAAVTLVQPVPTSSGLQAVPQVQPVSAEMPQQATTVQPLQVRPRKKLFGLTSLKYLFD